MNREHIKAELADKIIASIVKSDFTVDVSKLDQDDLLLAASPANTCETIDARLRCDAAKIAQAASWLESSPRGAQLLDEALERDLAELNEREEVA